MARAERGAAPCPALLARASTQGASNPSGRAETLLAESLQLTIQQHWLEPKPSVRPKRVPAQRADSNKLGPCLHAVACSLLPPPRVTKAVVEPMPLPMMRTARRAAQESCKRITPASPTGSRQIRHDSSFCTSTKAHRVQPTKLILPPKIYTTRNFAYESRTRTLNMLPTAASTLSGAVSKTAPIFS